MSRPDAFEQFDAAYWEDRYRSGEGAGRHDPGPALLSAAAGLRPGRALDAGCGVGADTLWLAARGWRVTAVDVSASALGRGRAGARAAGTAVSERITWVEADLTAWAPAEPAFDLVTSHYVHVPGPPQVLLRRLASWVAPGGTLLVVGHDDAHDDAHDDGHDDGHDHGQARPAGAVLTAELVLDDLPGDAWDVVAGEPRTHVVAGAGSGAARTLHDVVVQARRRAATDG